MVGRPDFRSEGALLITPIVAMAHALYSGSPRIFLVINTRPEQPNAVWQWGSVSACVPRCKEPESPVYLKFYLPLRDKR